MLRQVLRARQAFSSRPPSLFSTRLGNSDFFTNPESLIASKINDHQRQILFEIEPDF